MFIGFVLVRNLGYTWLYVRKITVTKCNEVFIVPLKIFVIPYVSSRTMKFHSGIEEIHLKYLYSVK